MAWRCALELNASREIVAGSAADLASAIQGGADLRVYTEFVHNEHIDVDSPSAELIREVAEFGVTYRVGDGWSAGIMSLRQPIALPDGFGPRSSMSFFLYNQDGTQAIARPHLDGQPATASPGPAPTIPPPNMPKYHTISSWDAGTNAPSENFIYDFELFRYCVNDRWRPVLHHGADGSVLSGSLEALVDAFSSGSALKVGIRGLCSDFDEPDSDLAPVDHEVFVQGGSAYYYTERRLFMVGTHPVVRVRPAVPMRYRTRGWDFGWLMVRTDGRVVYRRCDPYSLAFTEREMQAEVRWFVG